VEDVDALHRAFSAANVPIEQPPHDTEWGSREMRLRDPDGNCPRFVTDVD
ncbi:VOC family protein, partial [Mesorhizobium sp. M2D.F.Ca.ET.160.01.1.1]